MFLKALEINGFKSFANSVKITFNQGITSIVGPNGSGKSNILDAVRWVLGEQNVRNLRGNKMEDIIFSGTQYRKSVGMAQVSLILDNSDNKIPINYSYIKVTRKLYRSGESEYYINNTKCRLKDVQELFMDTGIGREGYSIISQGKIEEILSGKPEDRRKLIEEAVGIVKFKVRKEEAERKLQNTEQNLIRINDILSTYEERIPLLEVERNKAIQFVELSNKLKVKEINMVLKEIDKIQSKNEELKSELIKFNNKNNSLNISLKKLSEKEYALNKKLEQLDKEINNKKKEFYDKKSQQKDLISESDILNERYNNTKTYIDKIKRQIDENKMSINVLEKEKREIDNIINELKVKLKCVNQDIDELSDKFTNLNSQVLTYEKRLKDLDNLKISLNNDINNKKIQINIYKNEIESLQQELEKINTSYKEYVKNKKIANNEYKTLKNKREEIKEKIENYNCELKQLDDKINVQNNLITKNTEVFNKLTQKCNSLFAKKQILINFDNKYDGYNKSIKALIRDIKNKKIELSENECCVLGNIINVKEGLEVAIETSLGNNISNVITSNDIIAKKLIKYLRQNKLGRATFLPINVIKGHKINLKQNIKLLNGFIGIASELVEYDKKFSDVIHYVLGRTIICDNIDNAIKIAKEINYKYKIVTIEGDIINPGGALTGGSLYHKSTNIFIRRREIKELEAKISNLTKEINNLKRIIENDSEKLKVLEKNNLKLRDDIYNKNIELTKVESELSKLNLDISNYTNLIENINKQTKEKKILIDDKRSKLMILEQKLKILMKQSVENETNYNDFESKLNRLKQDYNNINIEITKLNMKKIKIDETITNNLNKKDGIIKEIERKKNKYKEFQSELEECKKKANEYLQKISLNKDKIHSISNYINDIDNKLKEREIERIKIKSDIERNREEIEQNRLLVKQNDKYINKHKIALAKYETQIENLYHGLNEKFNLTFAQALEYKIQNANVNKLKTEISEIKNKISKLGVVNLGAINEYDELKQKFDFMNSQRQDLIQSKDALNNAIRDLTNNMKTVFKNNFKKIRILFNETFKELFKGGSADLILDEGDELSSKIEINVQPPGKKLQNINLMSGGEKVLSAIALLFAILKMKPTPFCILDEIEAALDDANVEKFAQFLKDFSNNIQFIVITHRKITMEASDTMYGVTMQEKGISKIASLNIKEVFN